MHALPCDGKDIDHPRVIWREKTQSKTRPGEGECVPILDVLVNSTTDMEERASEVGAKNEDGTYAEMSGVTCTPA